ncbi:M20/M25/M40 family metallo-hydrolase, partial [bacterium]|nr:M20/M25/M40 family metallo-hydrolase [bacterium]
MTKELIAIPSISGSEKAKVDFISKYLTNLGLYVEKQEVEPNRHNVYAHFPNNKPSILFNTHIDTVPPHYGPDEDNDNIYGRGACDTCGILASFMEAFRDLVDDGIKDIGFILTVDEEVYHIGAKTAGKKIEAPKFLIVGEPTKNKLIRGGKGMLGLVIKAHGKSGHSGYIENFDPAIHKLIDLLAILKNDIHNLPTDPELGQSSVNIGVIDGGKAHNIVSDYCRADILYRTTTQNKVIKDKIIRLIDEYSQTLPKGMKHFDLKWTLEAEPLRSTKVISGFDTDVVAYGTDIPSFNWNKTQIFLLGPGDCLNAHKAPSD